MSMIEAKVLAALARIRGAYSPGLYVGHSGGKDSAVILNLVDRALPNVVVPIVHTPKPTDTHPLTVSYLYRLGRPVLYLPSDASSKLWPFTDNALTVQVDGTRIDEHDRTDGRSTDFVDDGVSKPRTELRAFVEKGLFGLSFCYPIYDWTTAEVWQYISENNIEVSEEYT